MRIAEIFHSLQGEGLLVGVPSAFVRTTGCNMRCRWCDSPYTSWEPTGESMSIDAILARVAAFRCRHVVVTGGEPLLIPEVVPLCAELRRAGHHVTVETAGTVYREVECDLLSLSPKLGNSTPHDREGGRFAIRHEQLRLQPEVLRRLLALAEYQVKFVVDRPEDIAEVLGVLATLPAIPPDRVLLMPQGVTRDELDRRGVWVAESCKEYGFRFCTRLHIELYGNRRGT